MISIDLLKIGDEVLSINEKFLAVKRKNGTVDLYQVMFTEENEVMIDPTKMATIGYGEGVVGKQLNDGETTVYVF